MNLVSKRRPIITYGTEKLMNSNSIKMPGCMFVKLDIWLLTKNRMNEKGKTNPRVRYLFDVETCKICPFQERCYKKGAKEKSYYVIIKSEEHSDQEAFQQTEDGIARGVSNP